VCVCVCVCVLYVSVCLSWPGVNSFALPCAPHPDVLPYYRPRAMGFHGMKPQKLEAKIILFSL
jgi:hypothetical protein